MADCEPEVHCIRGMAVDISEITTANPIHIFDHDRLTVDTSDNSNPTI